MTQLAPHTSLTTRELARAAMVMPHEVKRRVCPHAQLRHVRWDTPPSASRPGYEILECVTCGEQFAGVP